MHFKYVGRAYTSSLDVKYPNEEKYPFIFLKSPVQPKLRPHFKYTFSLFVRGQNPHFKYRFTL